MSAQTFTATVAALRFMLADLAPEDRDLAIRLALDSSIVIDAPAMAPLRSPAAPVKLAPPPPVEASRVLVGTASLTAKRPHRSTADSDDAKRLDADVRSFLLVGEWLTLSEIAQRLASQKGGKVNALRVHHSIERLRVAGFVKSKQAGDRVVYARASKPSAAKKAARS